ncbi:MAG: diacylglycerol kinase family protein [Planctomycetota bacterium]|nr:diacylglycerol kinase family protein [Planctomycetota bacterium]
MNDKPRRAFELTGRIRSFRFAIRGICRLVSSQHNAWIHAAATLLVVVAGAVLQVSTNDWCWIIVATTMVWTAEALNTSLEFLADAACPDIHPLVRDAKDVSAGAVLISAMGATMIGTIVFWPYVVYLRSSLMD